MEIEDLIKGCWARLGEFVDSNEDLAEVVCQDCDRSFDMAEYVWRGETCKYADWFDNNYYCADCACEFSNTIQRQVADKVSEVQMGGDA